MIIGINKRTDWKTPKKLYKELDRKFNFDFDPCPLKPKFDGLTIDWKKSNYVNPPYGTGLINWIKKGYEESQKGKTVVMLLPSSTDTKYWHKYVMKAKEIWFIKGRLKFDDQDKPASFPSIIAIFKKGVSASPTIKSVDNLAQEL